ncbi:helix-turn-helix transcriptional regulator [Spirosoma taeanense]|uniref:Helix-turn-helix transcriptional regulator n=1 Tax=Spirosoma taeanense TaxID=2735870 RepID=A0A6M5Y6U0_9BACT|nr:AraC family transcriptional regulator [Spirosoma taeanense]QJW90107.1 helix-turn-helix transcriptional regulator [Spirosoma taeanense]
MFYQKYSPAHHLKPFIECYYAWESIRSITPDTPLVIESPPNGFGSMVFNTGQPYAVQTLSGLWHSVPPSFVMGQSTQQYWLRLTGPVRVIGIVFRPAGLSALFGLDMVELTNERVDLTAILGPTASILIQQIADCSNPTQKVAILEQFLSFQLLRQNTSADRIDHATNLIVEQKGIIQLDMLIEDAFLCRRQFERKFLHRVGVSPKYYARIRRVGYLCAQLAGQRWQISDWQDLICRFGYYDQSHFIREFKAFTGKQPSLYVKDNVELGNFLES